MTHNISKLTDHKLADYLRQHGVQPTIQRLAIARALFAKPQHVSADHLHAQVATAGSAVSKATVYNTLRLFVGCGLAREVIVDPDRVFYDSTVGPHYHFYNADTGELMDIPADAVRFSRLPAPPDGLEQAGVDVIVHLRRRR